MMNVIRKIIGNILLFLDRVFKPKSIGRPEDQQRDVDEQTKQLTLYYFPRCPFCIKVDRQIRRLKLNIEKHNILEDKEASEELVGGGGKRQVPCLRIDNNENHTWLYESNAINRYLSDRFAPAS